MPHQNGSPHLEASEVKKKDASRGKLVGKEVESVDSTSCPPEFLEILQKHFGACISASLVKYAAEDINTKELELNKCPQLSCAGVVAVMYDTRKSASCIDSIRDSCQSTIALRIVLELIFKYAMSINLKMLNIDAAEIRRSACHLLDCLLLHIPGPHFKNKHSYLLVHSIRVIVQFMKVPRPALIRYQYIEYVLNPASRALYLGQNNFIKMSDEARVRLQQSFRESFSRALRLKYIQLTEAAPAVVQAKAQAYSVLARITERLFGTAPQLFGSGTAGLATSTSDVDVTILLSPSQRKLLIKHAMYWRDHNAIDYCPFPAACRAFIKMRRQKRIRGKRGGKEVGARPDSPIDNGSSPEGELKRIHIGDWSWLTSRPSKEAAAIWAGRMLGRRLAQLGWLIECVEAARVPIVRVTAAINASGMPVPVLKSEECLQKLFSTQGKSDVWNYMQRTLANSYKYLDNTICVGREPTDDCIAIGGDNARKLFWELSPLEVVMVNKAIDRYFTPLLKRSLPSSKTELSSSVRLLFESQHQQCSHSTAETASSTPLDRNLSQNVLELNKSISKNYIINMDVGFGHEVVVHNSQLLRAYAQSHPLVPIIGVLIKHWASQREVCNAYDGTLSGYQWMLMIIHYLQYYSVTETRRSGDSKHDECLPVLPNLQLPTSPPIARLADGKYNVHFCNPHEAPREILCMNDDCKLSEKELYIKALELLAPVRADAVEASLQNNFSGGLDGILRKMRSDSAPRDKITFTDIYPKMSANDDSRSSLATAFTSFFDYYGLSFNFYSHVISITRTPSSPQRKTECFNFEDKPDFIAPGVRYVNESDLLLNSNRSPSLHNNSKIVEPLQLEIRTDDEIEEELIQTCDNEVSSVVPCCLDESVIVTGDEKSLFDVVGAEDESIDVQDEIDESTMQNKNSESASSSDDNYDDNNEAERRLKAAKRASRIAKKINDSRSIRAFRNRQYICILDPFEDDRTIGTRSREKFSEIIFNFLRVRALILNAESEFCNNTNHSIEMNKLVNQIFEFAKQPQRRNNYSSSVHPWPDPKDSLYNHPAMKDLSYNDKYSSRINSQILSQIENYNKMMRELESTALDNNNNLLIPPIERQFKMPLIQRLKKTRNKNQTSSSSRESSQSPSYQLKEMLNARKIYVMKHQNGEDKVHQIGEFKEGNNPRLTKENKNKRLDIPNTKEYSSSQKKNFF